jgi:sulfite oxidase
MVNGSDLKPFWSVYKLHNRPHIKALLQEFAIGRLSPEDTRKQESLSEFANVYDTDPDRREDMLRVVSRAPYNAEPHLDALMESFMTPNDVFFIRNHNNVPDIQEEDWQLEIEANPECGIKGCSFTLKDLKTKFEKVEVVAALQCAGNRQEDYVTKDRPLYVAPHWTGGAIGCARWGGVRVRDLLRECGMPVDDMSLGKLRMPDAQIVNFMGEDQDETGTNYAAVVPVSKCIDPFGDTILAYEMNGETLPRDHGYPIRALAPGTGGCRNCKWVKHLSVSAKPSELDSGSKLDRHFANTVTWASHRDHIAQERKPGYSTGIKDGCEVQLDKGPVIQSLPIQSVLCSPPNNGVISAKDGWVRVQGVAYSGGGRGVVRVEVSVDGGNNFFSAELKRHEDGDTPPAEFGVGRNWAWVQFSADVELPDEAKAKLAKGNAVDIEVVSKAIDGDFNSQPESMRSTWNVLGICVNHWPRHKVRVDPQLPATLTSKRTEMPAPGAYWHYKHDA